MGTNNAHFTYVTNCLDQDIKEFSRCLEDFELDFRQMSKGRFNARTTIVRTPNLVLTRRTTSTKYSVAGKLPDMLLFYFPLQPFRAFTNGLVVGPDVQLISMGRTEFFSFVPEGYDHLIVSIAKENLYGHLTERQVSDFVALAAQLDFCLVNPMQKLSLTRKLFDIFMSMVSGSVENTPQTCTTNEAGIIQLLYSYLQSNRNPEEKKASTQEKLLQRAISLIESQPTRMFSLEELSSEIYASKRAIQYAFETIVGISPMRYIKRNRLNMIRKELIDPENSGRISDIISKYSFSNSGRTVKEYTELFFEKPSATVEKQVL